MEEAGYTDTLPLVSRYLGHINRPVQEAILALDTMPVGLEATMSAALDREAHLIRKAGLVPVMRSFQGNTSNQRPGSQTSITPSNPSASTTPTPSSSPRFVTLTPPKLPKEVTDPELIAAMTKPFTSTKGNEALRSKMLSNKICLLCRWHKSHATGCPRSMEHARATDVSSPTPSLIEEVKEEDPSFY